ncbi:LysR family transcriptional regulator [Ligilactobacillus equi]|uniref:LysR family transcriptional regulator n=1 Tax=Ligilactobacillus equi TaxID=137357 RepID=UPI002ED2B5C7
MHNIHTLYQILQAAQLSKTLSEVAQKLYLSQPYISKVLKKSENEYGVTLIQRKNLPISLTLAGTTVYHHLKRIIDTENSLAKELKLQKHLLNRPLRIAVTNPFLYEMVMDLGADFQMQNPGRRLEITGYPLENSLQVLEAGQIDLLIGRRYVAPNLHTLQLPANQVYSLISDGCSIYQADTTYIDVLDKMVNQDQILKMIGFANTDGISDYIRKRLGENGIQVEEVFRVDTVAEANLLVKKFNSHRHDYLALSNVYLANKYLGNGHYNLAQLPEGCFNFDNALMYVSDTSEIVQIANYLQQHLTKILQAEEA